MTPEVSLLGFGFTELEAALYCALLREAPASGYALAKRVGKAQANVYQALAALLRKGAVMVEEGPARSFRPAPHADLLAALERGFLERKRAAADLLSGIGHAAGDDRIYQLKAVEPLYARAQAMVEQAEEVLLFDFFPGPYRRLSEALADASARGVMVAGIAYDASASAPPFTLVAPAPGWPLGARWPGEQLTLVADAREHLVALLDRDGERVVHGLWSDSPYLSCLQHNGLASEIRTLDLAPAEDDRLAGLSLLRAYPPGLAVLLDRPRVDA